MILRVGGMQLEQVDERLMILVANGYFNAQSNVQLDFGS